MLTRTLLYWGPNDWQSGRAREGEAVSQGALRQDKASLNQKERRKGHILRNEVSASLHHPSVVFHSPRISLGPASLTGVSVHPFLQGMSLVSAGCPLPLLCCPKNSVIPFRTYSFYLLQSYLFICLFSCNSWLSWVQEVWFMVCSMGLSPVVGTQ